MMRRLLLLLLPLVAVCCSDDFTYSSSRCYLVIDNSIHQNPVLATAMNPMTPGVFCLITADEPRHQYHFENNSKQEATAAFTAIDQRMTRIIGQNNAIIVGYGTLTGVFYAYDRECPNCFDPQAIPVRSKPLALGQDGMATCPVCKRRYDMNNGGNCIYTAPGNNADRPKGMTRYRGSATGPYGRLAVTN